MAAGDTGAPLNRVANVESWNGTSWTETTDINTARRQNGGNGTQTSGLIYGGDNPNFTGVTESWNGTSWTEVNDLNTARNALGSVGADNTTALAFAGNSPAPTGGATTAITESWDGSSWTEVNDLNNGRHVIGSSGNTTSALSFGGFPSPKANTEDWNGVSWVEVADLSTGRSVWTQGTGTTSAGLASGGGNPPGVFSSTEEWSSASDVIKVLTD